MSNRRRRRSAVFAVASAGVGLSLPLPTAEGAKMQTLTDKTLVAWVYLANIDQRGGSALTLDNLAGAFDGIVFGEIAPGKWMAGSNYFSRTPKDQSAWPAEAADPQTLIRMAVVYKGKEVTLYRDDRQYAQYTIEQPQPFGPNCAIVMGRRHLEATNRAYLAGAIDEARVYDTALSGEQVAALEPGKLSAPEPYAWWTFDEGQVADRMGRFTECLLEGGARLAEGRLHLDGKESLLVAAPPGTVMDLLRRPSAQGDELVAAARRHRARLLTDRQRPTYHFVTPEGACMPFDPNGALFWKGKYHLCYLFQDERGHCWGHASSADLVHWRFHPAALAPNPGDPDRGIFSGNAFVSKAGEAVLLYHGVGAGNCIATSSEDELDNWTKLPSNPLVPIPKEGDLGFGKYQSWDPHGWLEGDTYYAVFGGNPATLFKSGDLVHWEFLSRFLSGDMPDVDKDEDISCPDFFKLGDKHMLLCISHKRGCRYYQGRFENEQFHPEFHARMNWPGGTCFAPESLLDGKGRRIMWAWALDRRTGEQIRESGWSGTMTLPRVLSLGKDGTLRIAPPDELQSLRLTPRQLGNLAVPADSEVPVDSVRGDCLELAVELTPGAARQCGLKVRCSPGGEEQTVIAYDVAKQCLRLDVAKSTLDPGIVHHTFCMYGGDNPLVTAQEAPFSLRPDEPLKLRVFLDRSILEVFANDRQCVTQRLYPTRDDSLGVALFSRGSDCVVQKLEAWDMAPANPW